MKHLRLTFLALLALPLVVAARPPYKKALADLLDLPASSRLNDCRTCHLPGTEEDRPHNAFGARLKAVRGELRKAGKAYDITARLLAVAEEDADGDGVVNLLELLAGTMPGDAGDKPTSLDEARKRQRELLASLAGYRWRPFDRVERPAVPVVRGTDWVRNPIDAFIAAEHEKRGLQPRPPASPEVLLRRVYLDLIGLPPTAEELREFLGDTRPDAYERAVARLLQSPRYGERWGRHWMDVWRYSDWAGWGQQVRDSQPHIWHWRDWIVEAANEDKPYDRRVLEMLAADELVPTDAKALRATGYLARNYKLLSREKWMQDTVDHTAMAFLGVTLGCARCHDHMYDPVTQKEYYQVRAIFTPHNVRTDPVPGVRDLAKNGVPRVFDADLGAETRLLIRGDDRTPDKTPLSPGVLEALGGAYVVAPIELPGEVSDPERTPVRNQEALQESANAIKSAVTELGNTRQGMLKTFAPDSRTRFTLTGEKDSPTGRLPLGWNPIGDAAWFFLAEQLQRRLALAEVEVELALARHAALEAILRVEALEPAGPKPSERWRTAAITTTRAQRLVGVVQAKKALFQAERAERTADLKQQAALRKKTAEAQAALKKAEAESKAPDSTNYTPRPVKKYPQTSTGRRLAFAKWIANRDNPLAARVAVNHVWLRHFGRGIVPGAFDFGRNAEKPSHPALLDWLAVEFMDRGWSMKELHRLIVTSATYRQASTPTAENLVRDADNVYLWRYQPRRLEAEVVRDAIYHVAGRLDTTMGGADIPQAQGLTVPRRSIYFQHAQEKQMEFLQIFDVATVTECYVRKQAVLPQQALALINSDLVIDHAMEITRQLPEDPAAFVREAFDRMIGRGPTADEAEACQAFLRERSAKGSPQRARENLVQVLYNHHEFVTVR